MYADGTVTTANNEGEVQREVIDWASACREGGRNVNHRKEE
jgi:hypothetical protein